MSGSSMQFHKIWIDQCEATKGIRERFGMKSALDYLIGEKLFHFVQAAEQHPEFAAELPAFLAEIERLFKPEEIGEYLDYLEKTKYLVPQEPALDLGELAEVRHATVKLDEYWHKKSNKYLCLQSRSSKNAM